MNDPDNHRGSRHRVPRASSTPIRATSTCAANRRGQTAAGKPNPQRKGLFGIRQEPFIVLPSN